MEWLEYKKQVQEVLLADANKEPISLQTICKLCTEMQNVKMKNLNKGQLAIFGRYQKQLKDLRDKVLSELSYFPQEIDEI